MVSADNTGRHCITDSQDQQHHKGQGGDHGGHLVTLEGLFEGVGGVDADKHDDKEEEHQDGAGVDDDLHHEKERRFLAGVLHGQTNHDYGQRQRRVDRLLGKNHHQGRKHHDRCQQPEGPLGCRHHRYETGEQGESRSHQAASSSLCWVSLSSSRCAVAPLLAGPVRTSSCPEGGRPLK